MTETVLLIDGTPFDGWQSMSCTRSVFEPAGTLEVAVSEGWHNGSLLRQIQAGSSFELRHRGLTAMVGYLDLRDIEYDADNHSVTLGGRDRMGDLVDCSAVHSSGQWSATPMMTIIGNLVEGFIDHVVAGPGVDLGKTIDFEIEPGETINDSLQRLAANQALLIYCRHDGALLVTRTGSERASTDLVLGKNILKGTISQDQTRRFHEYRVRTSRAVTKWTGVEHSKDARGSFSVTDPGARRPRRFLIDDDNLSGSDLELRAQHERALRAGQGDTITHQIAGWMDGEDLWRPNRKAGVTDAYAQIDADLLVATVNLQIGDDGHRCDLTVTAPEALLALPEPVEPLQSRGWTNKFTGPAAASAAV